MKLPRKHALAAFVSVAITGLATSTIAAESAQATAGLLKMEINTTCSDGNAYFRIKNAGKAWPKTSTFAIWTCLLTAWTANHYLRCGVS